MTDAERRDAWRAISSGKSRVVIGPRSALFAPVKDLGLIVVDEEHEGTYKQDNTPRYHARDTAIMRCRLEHAVALLGSATPSLESWQNAETGKFTLLELKKRVHGEQPVEAGSRTSDAGLASVEIIDMAQECREQHQMTFFSRRLRGACSAALERDEQVIIFLNRRGSQIVNLPCEEHELRFPRGRLRSMARGEQAEPRRVVDVGKNKLFVLEAIETYQRLLLHNVLEEPLGGVVGSDARRQHASDAAARAKQVAHPFGEHGIGIYVASAAEWIPAAVAY
jgi:hypothetical protein